MSSSDIVPETIASVSDVRSGNSGASVFSLIPIPIENK